MKLVRATKQSEAKKIKIKELGRIAKEGEVFEVSDERYNVLSGANVFKTSFVTLVRTVSADEPIKKQTPKISQVSRAKIPTPAAQPEVKEGEPAIKIQPEVEEEPDIYVIEPHSKPVKVDKDLNPIVEEESKPKKKNKKKKASVEE